MKGSGLMLHVFGIVVSSVILSISQPLTNNNGWKFLSAASSHCSCPCCKGVCHCGMEKNIPPVSSKSSKPKCPCSAKSNHFPESPSTPIFAGNTEIGSELVKNLAAATPVVPVLFKEPPSLLRIPSVKISPPVFSAESYPLRV